MRVDLRGHFWPLLWRTVASFRRLWQEIAWLSLGQVLSLLGVVVGVKVVTTLLAPDAFGELALALTVATLVSQIVLGPLSNAAERFYVLARESNNIPEFIAATKRLTLRTSIGILAVGSVMSFVVTVVLGDRWLLLALASVVFALLNGWDKILSGIQNAARQRATVAWHQVLREWLKPAFAVVALVGFHSSAAALAAYSVASLGVLASQLIFLRRIVPTGGTVRTPASVDVNLIGGRMLYYGLPFAAWGIFTWLQLSSDRWALQLFADPSSVGLYAAVYQVGVYPLTIFTGLILQLVAPVLLSQVGDGRERARVRGGFSILAMLCLAMLSLTLVAFLVGMLAQGLIFRIFLGPQYSQVSNLLPWTILAGGLFNAGQLAALGPLLLGNSRSLLFPTIGTALISVFMNLGAAYFFGIQGVVGALIIFSATYLSSVALVGIRLFRQSTALAGPAL